MIFRTYYFGISESSEFWKRQTSESSTTRNKRMRILKTAELEIKAIFIGGKLGMTSFLLFDIWTTAGPLEVYLQNLTSLQSLQNLPAFETEGFEAFKFAVFLRDSQKNTFLMSVKSVKNRRGRKIYQKNTPLKYYSLSNYRMVWPKSSVRNTWMH